MRRADLERLKEQIDRLDPHEQHQLFKVVQKYTTDFTSTETGVLVQASVLPEPCLKEIKIYVAGLKDQKKRMDEDQQTRKAAERLMTQ
jgi:hypothetical protein